MEVFYCHTLWIAKNRHYDFKALENIKKLSSLNLEEIKSPTETLKEMPLFILDRSYLHSLMN